MNAKDCFVAVRPSARQAIEQTINYVAISHQRFIIIPLVLRLVNYNERGVMVEVIIDLIINSSFWQLTMTIRLSLL